MSAPTESYADRALALAAKRQPLGIIASVLRGILFGCIGGGVVLKDWVEVPIAAGALFIGYCIWERP